MAPVKEDESSAVAAVKGAIKESGKKGGSGCIRSFRLKTQLKALDEDKIKRQLESSLCYTHYQAGARCHVPGRVKTSPTVQLKAAGAGQLVYLVDQLTGRRLSVDTGFSFSILPHQSTQPASGPKLEGPASAAIPCWGDILVQLKFSGLLFE